MEKLIRTSFEPFVGTIFEVTFGERIFPLTLEAVEDKSHPGVELPEGFREPFSLSFSCPDQEILPDAVYTLSHPELGENELFIKPYAQNAQGVSYESVFG